MKLEMLRRACNKLPACRLLPTRRRGVGRAGGGEGTQATNAVVSADPKPRYNMADCWFGQRAVARVIFSCHIKKSFFGFLKACFHFFHNFYVFSAK